MQHLSHRGSRKKTIRLLVTLLAATWLSGCSSVAQFDDNEQLTRYVASLVPSSTTVAQARISLAQHGFECFDQKAGDAVCRRKAPGLVCNQVQVAFLPVAGDAVGRIRTQLEHICL